jgi:hypothetical protein
MSGTVFLFGRESGSEVAFLNASLAHRGCDTVPRVSQYVVSQKRMLRALRRQMCELLTASPDGIPLTDIPPRYEALFRRKLDPRAYGCQQLLHLLQAVSDTVYIKMQDNGTWIASLTEQAQWMVAQAQMEEVWPFASFQAALRTQEPHFEVAISRVCAGGGELPSSEPVRVDSRTMGWDEDLGHRPEKPGYATKNSS